MKTSKLLRRFSKYYKSCKLVLIFDLFCASLTTLCDLFFPLIVQFITDTATNNIEALTMQVIFIVGAIYVAMKLIDSASKYFMNSTGHIMGAGIETEMRDDMYNHLMKFSFGYYSSAKVGSIISRLTADLFEITELAHHCPEEFFIAIIKLVVSFVILATFNIYIALILFAIFPIMLLFTAYFNKKMRKQFRQQRVILAEINSQVEDSLLGIRVVKSFNGESSEINKFRENNIKFFNTKRTSYKYMAGFHTTVRIFDGLMYIIGVIGGTIFLINKLITIGEFTAIILYISILLDSVRRILEFMEQFQRGLSGLDRFYEIMDTEVDMSDSQNAIDIGKLSGYIEFINVSFAYPDSQTPVLQDIDLKIDSGESVAIVGTSGGGKTTMCNLIPRFYDITHGDVIIDGMNIKNMTMASLRSNIGIVQQDVYLFSGTIAENIAYGKKDSTMDEIIQAAKAVGADEFIMKAPNGYDSYVGERGIKLSGGQKQRISIARIFLKNPPILILDEATSSLDNESEKIVQHSLELLSRGRTTITIAHRLSTIKNVDRIIVINNSQIEEIGTHNQLMDKKGAYFNMQNM